jgi:hypothetical protein
MSTTMLNHLVPANITLAAHGARFYVTHFDYMRFFFLIISYVLDCFAAAIRVCSLILRHVYSSSAMGFVRRNISARRAATCIARDMVHTWMLFSERIRIFRLNDLLSLSARGAERRSVMESWKIWTSLTQNIGFIGHAGSMQRKWLFRVFASIDTSAFASQRLLMLLHHVKQSVLFSTHTFLHGVFHLGNSESGTVELEQHGLLRAFQAWFYCHVPPFVDWARAHILYVLSRVHLPSFSLCCGHQSLFGKLPLEPQLIRTIKDLVFTVSGIWESFTGGLLILQGSLRRRVICAGEKPCVAVARAFSGLVEVYTRPDETHLDNSFVESRYGRHYRLVLALFICWMALRHLNRRIKNPYFDVFTPSDTLLFPQVVFFVAKIFLKVADWNYIRRRPFFRDPVDVYVHNMKEYCNHIERMIRVGMRTRIAAAKTYLHGSLLGATQAWQEAETLSPNWDGYNVISTMEKIPKGHECTTKGLAQSSAKDETAPQVRIVKRYRKEPAATCKPISKDEVCKCAVCKKRIDDIMDSVIGGLCGVSV